MRFFFFFRFVLLYNEFIVQYLSYIEESPIFPHAKFPEGSKQKQFALEQR